MDWAPISRIPHKAALYGRETYFREGLSDALDAWQDAAFGILHDTALVLVKPDGLAAAKTGTIVDYLEAHGFAIAAREHIVLNRFVWRELWRHQLTAATLDRLAVNDLIFQGPALLLLLRQEAGAPLPASVRLSGLKGSADLCLQSEHSLRHQLRQPNRLFSFVHVADEPADVLRELGIFLDGDARRRVLCAVRDGGMSATERQCLLREAGDGVGRARVFDTRAALQRVHDEVAAASGAPMAEREQALDALAQMRMGKRIAWRPFARALAVCGAKHDRWDIATLGACFIQYEEVGEPKVIEAVDQALWNTGDGGLSG